MANGEHNDQMQFTFRPVMVPQGDGSYLIKPGKPIERENWRVAEVAKYLSVTERHVIDLIEEGKLSAIDVGGSGRRHWRVPVAAMEKFVSERKSK